MMKKKFQILRTKREATNKLLLVIYNFLIFKDKLYLLKLKAKAINSRNDCIRVRVCIEAAFFKTFELFFAASIAAPLKARALRRKRTQQGHFRACLIRIRSLESLLVPLLSLNSASFDSNRGGTQKKARHN